MSDYDEEEYEEDYDEDEEEDDVANITDTPVGSYEAGLDHQRAFILNSKGAVNFSILFENVPEVGFSVHQRVNGPCYGPMRPYGPDSDRPKDPKPPDFRDHFPRAGNPVTVAAPFKFTPGVTMSTAFIDAVFNPETSPWRILLEDHELIMANDQPKGILLKNTHVDPTLIVEFLMFIRTCAYGSLRYFDKYFQKSPDADRRILLLLHWLLPEYPRQSRYISWGYDYYLSGHLSVKNFLNGVNVPQSPTTFYNRSSYNRPNLQDVFGRSEQDIVQRLRPLPDDVTERDIPEIINRLSNLA